MLVLYLFLLSERCRLLPWVKLGNVFWAVQQLLSLVKPLSAAANFFGCLKKSYLILQSWTKYLRQTLDLI